MISPDPGCIISDGTDIDFTFGLLYTGDQGEEPAGDGSGRMVPCITQSKVDWSSFNFDLVGNFIHEGRMKDTMHTTLDSSIMSNVFGRTTSRCARWRQMP